MHDHQIGRMNIERQFDLAIGRRGRVGPQCGVWEASDLRSASVLHGVKPIDPLTFVLVSLTLLGVTLLACHLPARRGRKVDPMVALRYEINKHLLSRRGSRVPGNEARWEP
jgi:hypothetical protein